MNIQQIKDKYTCLDWLGEPVKRDRDGSFLYRVPWREDHNPSLAVTPNGKGWRDRSRGDHGNLIDLVMRCLNTSDLRRVCAAFETAQPNSFSFPQSKSLGEGRKKETAFAAFGTVPLQSHGLYAYLQQRGIALDVAKQFLQEAHYSFGNTADGKYFYALAYRNDLGGYELRSQFFKGSNSPKGITTHWMRPGAPTVVFEGFMDMLSFATLCGEARHNYVTLNSVVNADAAIGVLRSMGNKVYLCLDNDEAGEEATRKMLDALPLAIDIRKKFSPAKDVNEYLLDSLGRKNVNSRDCFSRMPTQLN